MKLKKLIFLGLPPIIVCVILTFVFGIFLIKWFWGWTIPVLFPVAVADGIIAGAISWWTALKLSVFISILVAMSHLTGD